MSFFKKKSTIIGLAVLLAVVIIISVFVASTYNGLVDKREKVEEQRSQISVVLKRRADLIPNFVNTVEGYSDYEQETYLAVTNARAAVNEASSPKEEAAASAALDAAVDVWVNAVTEAYPDLKANEQYKELLVALEGSENRIANERRKYNEAVKDYNAKIKRFPTNIVAGMFNFDAAEYFEIDPADSAVPEVSFK